MSHSIGVKKAFTLIELMLVILLISSISFLAFSNFNFNSQKKYKVGISNLKEFLIENFEFQKKLSFVCIEDEFLDCYVFIDEIVSKSIKVENFFKEIPSVYNYDKELSNYSFSKIRLDNIEFEPFFEFRIDYDNKHKNIVIDTLDENVYLLSSTKNKPIVFKSTNEIIDRFFEQELEVKDAL